MKTEAQTISLQCFGESEDATKIIDSLGYNSTFNNYKNLDLEITDQLQRFFKLGYLESELTEVKKQNDTLYYAKFFLGKRVKTISVRYSDRYHIYVERLKVKMVDDDVFKVEITEIESVLERLSNMLSEDGDPFTKVKLLGIQKIDSGLVANLGVVESQKRKIDRIVVKGYENFPKSYIRRFLKLKPETTFNIDGIKKKTQLLDQLRFARQLREPEVLFSKDSTILYLYIEKSKTNNFDGFLGFGTNENSNRIEFDGYLNLQLINNLNFGETLKLLYKSDEIDQQTFNVTATLPYLFASPLGLDVGLNIFKKDSTFLTVSQQLRLTYQFNSKNKMSGGINSINSSNLLDTDTNILNDYNSNFYTLNYQHIELQYYDVLFPVNFQFDITGSFGDRKAFNRTTSQNLFNLETYKIFNLNDRNSLYTRLTGAILLSDDYLDNELFRFGGINSIRGFEENSLVGNLFSVLNTEYRYRLSESIYVHSVIDVAYFENKLIENKSKLFGFGFGLLTNAGIFKFNYASAKTENSPFRLSDSKIHISLTATF